MNEQEKKELQALCLDMKAERSVFIDPASIKLGPWTRYKCQYGCNAYGKNLCCPPHSPTAEETEKILADYRSGLLVMFGSTQISPTIAQLERALFLKNYYKVISFGAGPCKLCKECSLSNCTNPRLARPSMEACGIDVYATLRNNGINLEVLRSRQDAQKRIGLLLIE